MKLIGTVAVLCVAAITASACTSSSNAPTPSNGTGSAGGSNGASTSSSGGDVVSDGTFTFAVSSDPGNLDPQGSAFNINFQLAQFAYDNLINENGKGELMSGLASSWKANGTKVTLTMQKNVTCSDGSKFTANDAAQNIDYVTDPKNKSPFLGVFIPAGAKAKADEAAGTVTITLAKPAPFVLDGLANLPMVCAKGMADRKSLASKTDGTGPYVLTQAVSGDHYTYARRAGYTWGPGGASTSTPGMPKTIVVKIVQNETTAANLLLSGGLTAATILGADSQRLQQAGLFEVDVNAVAGEMWFNQQSGRPGADPAVRQALTSALDLDQAAKVLTSGRGGPGTEFAALPPVACPGNSVKPALPAHDLDKAKQELDAAGWKVGSDGTRSKDGKPLTINFIYNNASGPAASSAAELATQAWSQLGAKVTAKGQDETGMNNALFSSGNWDVAWVQLNVSSPDQLVPFLSGPVPPNGTNFAHINNSQYTQLVTKASTENGSAGCPDWLMAEEDLVRAADVIPFANQVTPTFGKNVSFQIAGALVPTSIRMLAG
jgi:peptide/nickel transport system substrate-binding protein